MPDAIDAHLHASTFYPQTKSSGDEKFLGKEARRILRNRLRTPTSRRPPELAVGTVVGHVNLKRFRLDGADLGPRRRCQPDERDYEHRSRLCDYTILPCVIRPALGEA